MTALGNSRRQPSRPPRRRYGVHTQSAVEVATVTMTDSPEISRSLSAFRIGTTTAIQSAKAPIQASPRRMPRAPSGGSRQIRSKVRCSIRARLSEVTINATRPTTLTAPRTSDGVAKSWRTACAAAPSSSKRSTIRSPKLSPAGESADATIASGIRAMNPREASATARSTLSSSTKR